MRRTSSLASTLFQPAAVFFLEVMPSEHEPIMLDPKVDANSLGLSFPCGRAQYDSLGY